MDLKLKFTAKPRDFIIFIIFCIFLLYLVAIGVLNLYHITHNNIFWGLNPFPAFGKQFIVSTLTLYLFALIGVFMSTSSHFFDREKGFGFGKKKDKEDPGWARWMKESEMKEAYNVKKIVLKDEEYEHAGIPIIINDKEAYVDDGENHSLIIGASGSGKTWTIIDPLVKILGKSGESMVITDPKGEIYEHNANLLRERGYKVILVNFRDPDMGSAWNPLSLPYRYYKQGKEDKAMELLEDLGVNILVDANNQDPFWQKSAADYFTGLALGLFEDASCEEEVNLNSINSMSTFGEERRGAKKYDLEYFKLKGELSSAYISAAATITAPADTKGGITSTFRQKIRIFSSRQKLAEMLSYTDFDVRNIGREKTAVFLKIHDEKTTYHALATIFVKQVYECLIDEAQKEENLKLKIRTNFILDEFANMPALKDVESMITASRSRNMRFNFVIQNFSQLNKVYGKEVAETIKGNCGNMFYLITTEYSALEEISKLLGEVKPKVEKDKPTPPIRPLVTVSDLQQMKQFEMIIKRWRNQPFKTKHTPSFKITQEGGWGYTEKLSGYTQRPERPIKTFDLKKFVDEKLGDTSKPDFLGGSGNPFAPPFGMQNLNSNLQSPFSNIPSSPTNVDDLVKKIDEQIAKLEEEERLEKEAQALLGPKSKEDAENDFEKLINKKYEDYKLEEDKAKLQAPKAKVDVDDLIKKIDAKIAELEKEEELETLSKKVEEPKPVENNFSDFITAMNMLDAKPNETKEVPSSPFIELDNPKQNNFYSSDNSDNDIETFDIEDIPFIDDFKLPMNSTQMNNMNNYTQNDNDIEVLYTKPEEPKYNTPYNNSNIYKAKTNEKPVPFESLNFNDIPPVSNIKVEEPEIEQVDFSVNSQNELTKLQNSTPFGQRIDDLLKPNSAQNTPIRNDKATKFYEEAREINNDIIKEQIEKPLINVDADSVIVDSNITDDEFFDDFFGNGE